MYVFRPFFPNILQLIPNPTQNNKGSTSEVKDRRVVEITPEKKLENKTKNVEEKTKNDRRRKRSNTEEQEELNKERKTEETMDIGGNNELVHYDL